MVAFPYFKKTLDTTAYVKADEQDVFVITNLDGTVTTPATPSASKSGVNQTYSLTAAGSTNANVVKNKGGNVTSINIFNASAALRYVKLYNKATAPTVGTDVPVLVYAVPATSSVNIDLEGQRFSNGIAIATTTGAADTDTAAVTAGDVKVSLNYR